ncbi:MAG TPA: hypothetical protein ENL09_00375 [Bacteroidetes bacterium]|nr:hypothetical protein [Bacteroidota bacterium]
MIKEYMDIVISNMSLNKLKYDDNIISEAFTLDIDRLDLLDSSMLSKYITALSQYLIYLTFELNKARAMCKAYKTKLESELLKGLSDVDGKTLKEKRSKIINTRSDLRNLESDITALQTEITVLEGLFNPIELYINALKREQTRRWNERELVRN